MLAGTHALTGAAAWLVIAPAVVPITPSSAVLGTAVAAGAALAPDLDHRSGTATHAWGPITRALGGILGWIARGHRAGTHALLTIGIVYFATWAAVEHAGSWPAMGVVALCAALAFIACEDVIPGRWERVWPFNLVGSAAAGWAAVASGMDLTWLPWAVAVGWAAHIAGDFLTTGGVPLLLPLWRRRFNLTSARTGGTWEKVAALVLTASIATVGSLTAVAAPDPWTSVWLPEMSTSTPATKELVSP